MRQATLRQAIWAGALAGILLSGGAGAADDRLESIFVAPGKYVLYDCAQLVTAEKDLVTREAELARLSARAKEGPAGGLISAFTYEPEYRTVRGQLTDLRNEKAAKNCAGSARVPIRPRR